MTREQEFRKQTEEAKFEAFSVMCEKVNELEKRIAKLEKQQFTLRNERNTFLTQNEQYEKDLIDFNEKLTKAKEIIEELYNIIPASMSDYAKEPMEHARKFMTEE